MSLLVSEIEHRLLALMRRLSAGDDAPPGSRLRLEGLLEAAVITGEDTEDSLLALLERCHREVFERDLETTLGSGWQEAHPFPEIPLFARRAPVSAADVD